MAARYRVEVTATAYSDLRSILDFISEDSPAAAVRWLEEMERGILSLERFPLRCPVVPEAEELGHPYRHLLFGNYRAILRVEERVVWVLRVLHGAQLLDTSTLEAGPS
ncbi:MAG: type II toxin-antitoxin system RelE/ParE family toxin [Planctomycetes bacterium]|nr:type II toxin-antitoxin system RelE/ParE family toxin [Planctomycetota bacterium]